MLDIPDEECRRRIRGRNSTKPAGLYFGDVSDEIVTQVLPYIVPPARAEGFRIKAH